MKIAVFGTPALAADLFESIRIDGEHEIVLAITTGDVPAGRGKKVQPPAVKVWAASQGIQVRQPLRPNAELASELKHLGIELLMVISYGKILSSAFLESVPPAWNLHFSLLPEYRGAAPVQSAILDGKTVSGLTVFRITAGLDTGPVIRTIPLEIAGLRADKVFERMLTAGKKLLPEVLADFAAGKITETAQDDSRATHSKKITKTDGLLIPLSDTAETALRKIRAYYPWPSAWIEKDGKRIKLLNASDPSPDNAGTRKVSVEPNVFVFQDKRLYLGFADGPLEILEIQPEGKRVMSGTEFSMGIRSNTTG